MLVIDPSKLTWGFELEFGDVPRSLEIPPQLGSWEYFETDIVNQLPPYRGIAVDPAGIAPPVGGEINTKPTIGIDSQLRVIEDLLAHIRSNGHEPTASCVSNTHIHVGIPMIRDRFIFKLKKLLLASLRYQDLMMDITYPFDPIDEMADTNTALEYLRKDSGRRISEEKVYEIICNGNNFDEFIDLYLISTDDPSKRYAINLLPMMRESRTIEFRFFRCTTDLKHMHAMMKICQAFLMTASEDKWIDRLLRDMRSYNQKEFSVLSKCFLNTKFFDQLGLSQSDFPALNYDHDLYLSWESTQREPDFSRLKPRAYLGPLWPHDPDHDG
jgi:hypothetical protein